MRPLRLTVSAIALLIVGLGSAQAQTPANETLGEVRVHGNHTTPDADVLALAGLSVGSPVNDAVLAQAAQRLHASGRFEGVELRKRFRSIDDPSDILVILLVDERPGVAKDNLMPGKLKVLSSFGMWLPILNYADGYGFTYGARFTFVDTLGSRSRISFPATWGASRGIAMEVEKRLERGVFTRVEGALALNQRENPRYLIDDTRREARIRAERRIRPWLRAGGGARLTDVGFGSTDGRYVAPGVDVILDTRIDPLFPRNAVHITAGIEQLRFDGGDNVTRWNGDVRGYVGLIRSSVLALRVTSIQASKPLPQYEQALLGGTTLLRGYDFGYRADDRLTALSAELRVPVTSPLNVGRLGVKGFVDVGTTYAADAKLADQIFDRGIGAGVFFTAPMIGASLDVAWPRGGAGPRWHFSLGVTF